MDTTDIDITFDSNGVCNHCSSYKERLKSRIYNAAERTDRLDALVAKIKKHGRGKEYDCIIGVSGGVDSTYVAYLVKKKLNLRPLAIHFDNGWNSELAVSNIEKTLKRLEIDLYTHVINWGAFKNLQKAFLYASTPDGEVPTDHAINALLFREANKRGIKYIISGMNFATESIAVKSWAYGHSDWTYIKDVHRKFCRTDLKGYPHFNFYNLFYWTFIRRIQVVSILNYLEYNKSEAMKVLETELGWVYYGGKHYESIYTRFYQGYVLPKKFNIDKRRGHLSDLIYSNQISREKALIELQEEPYQQELLKSDFDFVLKKLSFSQSEFETIMKDKTRTYKDYKNTEWKIDLAKKIVNFLRLKGIYSK